MEKGIKMFCVIPNGEPLSRDYENVGSHSIYKQLYFAKEPLEKFALNKSKTPCVISFTIQSILPS